MASDSSSTVADDPSPRSDDSGATSRRHFVVVAVDFGTALSGYAFAFVRDPCRAIHMMRRWDGGDPGVINQKTPTTLLLDPVGRFHSFGYTARDFYHDLDEEEARQWLFFDKFKMTLHHNDQLSRDTLITAANGKTHRALDVFAHALRYFRQHALQELSDQTSTPVLDDDIRWVITVPAIWKPPARQFMRLAATQAGMTSDDHPERLVIALEPEAASIYVRKLRLYQLVPETPSTQTLGRSGSASTSTRTNRFSYHVSDTSASAGLFEPANRRSLTLPHNAQVSDAGSVAMPSDKTVGTDVELKGTRYIVVDCGGGTVDITTHEMDSARGDLHEIFKATGGPHGSVGIDEEFEKLLANIFGRDFIETYKLRRPSGWTDLMVAFESRKRSANPNKNHPLNVCLPFSFIEQHKKLRGCQVESAINKFGNKDVRWSSQGMIRLSLDGMKRLFEPTVDRIKNAVHDVVANVTDLKYMFLVGGFAESPILQREIRQAFGAKLKVLIPQDVALTILKGAVCNGLEPGVVTTRRSALTYGVEVLHRFDAERHPRSKKVHKDGVDWCMGIFDTFVHANQEVPVGQTIVRRYSPASMDQSQIIISIYSSESPRVAMVSEPGVTKCGRLRLQLDDGSPPPAAALDRDRGGERRRREVETTMTFGDTEIKVGALDVATGNCVRACVEFLGSV